MSITQTTFYGTGNFFYNTNAQNGVYQNHAFTSPLKWELAYTAPTPTGVAFVQPTESVSIPEDIFMGFSDGFWVHKLFLNGHLVGTYTFVDQQFALPVKYDYIQSVAMPVSSMGMGVGGVAGEDPCVPSPTGAATLLLAALFCGTRSRKN